LQGISVGAQGGFEGVFFAGGNVAFGVFIGLCFVEGVNPIICFAVFGFCD
jgi:hypothetical protein